MNRYLVTLALLISGAAPAAPCTPKQCNAIGAVVADYLANDARRVGRATLAGTAQRRVDPATLQLEEIPNGKLQPAAPSRTIAVLDVDGDMAAVAVYDVSRVDYLQIGMAGGHWKVINTLSEQFAH
ncbi:nuclear transport factor 2 family protein [Jeongeupia chitinilytica]|uniref:Uncharacterized protein n=1 Tax=Jeongeupia chitinilytica TaxID=1041641 RepID=A0ABQ3GXL0_9NEIS|nr:nuclear transport factor 2 family protein [Jeongeupia chitinilytica]GHD60096.1 hypothetical protein GCM10007350_12520 [Jeongeupia chitinilytica]